MTIHRDTRDLIGQTDRIERGRVHLSCGDNDRPAIQDRLTIQDVDDSMSWAMKRFIRQHNKTVEMKKSNHVKS